jgi:glycosyltransferase involved in cell wall biosynthesis
LLPETSHKEVYILKPTHKAALPCQPTALPTMSQPHGLVSVILPTYNRYEHLLHALRSCLNQTYPHIEVIVVDDASTDPRYRDGSLDRFPRTTVLHLPVNQRQKYGTPAAQGMTRQEGLLVAQGEWIAFLDDDDWFEPNKIERQLEAMTEMGFLFCSTNMTRIHHTAPPTPDTLSIQPVGPYFPFHSLPPVLTPERIQQTNYVNNSSVLLHRSIVERTGAFHAVPYEDWDYWKRTGESVLYLDEPLVNYTVSTAYERKKDYVYPVL